MEQTIDLATQVANLTQLVEQLMEANQSKDAKIAELEAQKNAGQFGGVRLLLRHDDRMFVTKKGEAYRGSGAISLYGFGQKPITLYPSHWLACILSPEQAKELGLFEGFPALRTRILSAVAEAAKHPTMGFKREDVRQALLKALADGTLTVPPVEDQRFMQTKPLPPAKPTAPAATTAPAIPLPEAPPPTVQI